MEAKYVCTTCGFYGIPRRITKGHFLIELVLWLAFIVPGLIYTIWRLTTKAWICPTCGGKTLIPEHSPIAQATLAQLKKQHHGSGS